MKDLKRIEKLLEARRAATQGDFKYQDQWVWSPKAIANFRSLDVSTEQRDANGDFFALARATLKEIGGTE